MRLASWSNASMGRAFRSEMGLWLQGIFERQLVQKKFSRHNAAHGPLKLCVSAAFPFPVAPLDESSAATGVRIDRRRLFLILSDSYSVLA
jgi:hypothetical protein